MLKVALVGNPNCGKTTLFNLLTNSKQYTGNRPGVTVDKKVMPSKFNSDVIIADLPGVYSLSPFSPEENYTRDYLIDEQPDAIINIIDASNLGRSLYLTTQLTETDIPMIIVLNMIDKLERSGSKIDLAMLSSLFDVPAICLREKNDSNLFELVERSVDTAKGQPPKLSIYSESIGQIISKARQLIPVSKGGTFVAIKALQGDEKYCSTMSVKQRIEIKKLSATLEAVVGFSCQDFFASSRYKFIDKVLSMCVATKPHLKSISQKIDKVVLSRAFAFPIFFAVIFLIYYVCITLSGSAVSTIVDSLSISDYINSHTSSFLKSIGCALWIQDLVLDGIFSAVGSVLSFLPQIFMLFLSLGFLEESGYMARIAFLTDRIFKCASLSGKTFIPLIIGSGCSVPALLSTRTIENDSQRRASIIVTPFIPCSAKLTVIAFVSSTMLGNSKFTIILAYILAFAAVLLSGVLLKGGNVFGGKSSDFIMELPSYIMPRLGDITKSAARQSLSFIKKAGSVILLSSVAVWFLSYFSVSGGRFSVADSFDVSLLGGIGNFIAPFFAPLGFGSGEMSVAVVSGMFAKENIVGTLEVLSQSNGLNLSAASAISFLTFNLLCPPCIVAINTIRREMNSTKHTAFALIYQTAFAYTIAFIIFNFCRLFI